MYAKCLIGKKVIRSGPNKCGDNSFNDYPIRIISANDCHIVYEYADDWHRTYMDTDRHTLNDEWCDNNWIDYHSTDDIYLVSVSCDNKEQASNIFNEIKKINNANWEYNHWITKSVPNKNPEILHYEVKAWIRGREAAERGCNNLNEVMRKFP